MPVEPESQNPVHFTFTWRDVDRVRSYREEHNKALIGWYHTHPDIGIFLSETDLERTHRVLFSEPFQVALVYDPVRGCAGYFFWEGAQKIDAAPAAWREFEIAVEPEPEEPPTAVEPISEPPTPVPTTAARAHSSPSLDSAAPQQTAATNPGVPLNAESETLSRRARVISVDDSPSSVPVQADEATPAPQTSLGTDATRAGFRGASPPVVATFGGPRPRGRALLAALAGILLVMTGLAMGYFWFGPGLP